MIAFLISVGLHPFWVHHFMIVKDEGLNGLAYAGGITNLTTYLIMRFLYAF